LHVPPKYHRWSCEFWLKVNLNVGSIKLKVCDRAESGTIEKYALARANIIVDSVTGDILTQSPTGSEARNTELASNRVKGVISHGVADIHPV
jgi:hypothetical protein